MKAELIKAGLELMVCPCGQRWLAQENQSPGVEREVRCQRCLVAEIARLQRIVDGLPK